MKIVQRLIALGLRAPTAVKLEALVMKWAECSGPEWTVRRLKSLKVELINRLAGRQEVAPWIRRNSDGLPRGVIAELFRIAEKSKRGRFVAINSLMIYSSFISEKVTEAQRKKFFSSMESDDKTGLSAVVWRRTPKHASKPIPDALPWTNVPLSGSSFQPGPDGKSYPETDTFISLAAAGCSKAIMSLVRKYSSVFNRVVPVSLLQDLWREGTLEIQYSSPSVNLCVGKVSYIQEPGFKLRAVANPNRILQAALEPLKDVLGSVVRSLPNDYTFDQDAGVRVIQSWLKLGISVHSIDLSDATNLFPLGYQISALLHRVRIRKDDKEYYESLVRLFNDISRSPWFTKEDGEIEVHSFTRGQPLGLGPSFFSFGFSHNILLQDICDRDGLPSLFCVLGDDVCIGSLELAVTYREELRKLGCKISEEKSLVSKHVAEFAGKLIFSDGDIVPQFKWRDVSDANVIDFCRNIGPGSLTLLSPRQKRLVTALAPIPDFIGGLGWNPEGIPLSERMKDPLYEFLLERAPTVSCPFRRIDTALTELMLDERVLRLSPFNISVNSGLPLIPTRAQGIVPQWASTRFWIRFLRSRNNVQLLPEYSVFDLDDQQPWYAGDHEIGLTNPKTLYCPSWKDGGDPRVSGVTPWFDLIRYFLLNQSRLRGES